MSENGGKSIILLSGGLDSVVSLGLCIEKYNVKLALTFDYGQKAIAKEIEASRKYCDFYSIEHKIIKLDWLKNITQTALCTNEKISADNDAKSVWVPNRNGLFLNIAAAFCDANNFNTIIIGANKEEAENFPDNTKEFINRTEKMFEYSTLVKPKIIAPLINYNKEEIVKCALQNNIPLSMLFSCYNAGEKHCGKCPSCVKLKSALEKNDAVEYIKELF